jgi:hypothetical protein
MPKSLHDQKFPEQARRRKEKERQKLVAKTQEKGGTGGLGKTVSKLEAARARRRRMMQEF